MRRFFYAGMAEDQAAAGPIGIFDSGVGGLTIWKAIAEVLPEEDTLYFADSAHAPYGDRSAEEILERSRRCTEWLLARGAKLIVVACNTATTNAIGALRREYPIPFIGIEPAIKPAALHSKTGCIGVLATRGTLGSDLFADTSRAHAGEIRILEQEGYGLVEAIEAGDIHSPGLKQHLSVLLDPMVEAGVDHLVLGCTHYPFIVPLLQDVLPPEVQVMDCAAPVARQTRKVLLEQGLLRSSDHPGEHRFFTNGTPDILDRLLRELGGEGHIQAL